MSSHILEMEHIVKEFPGVRALDDVTFQVEKGEIHALVGENGAGKSTLMKVLSGIHPHGSYSGRILFDGKEVSFRQIRDSEESGIAIINQELALCKNMNVAESVFLGQEIHGKNKLIDWNHTYSKCKEFLEKVNLDISPDTKIINLGVGQQQLVEIAKALSKNVRLLILDEPTAPLTDDECENLMEILRDLKSHGVSCIYISHKLDEVFEIADHITVLRDGKTIVTKATEEMTKQDLIAYMVGRKLEQMFPRVEHTPGKVLMEVKDWTIGHPEIRGKNVIDHVSFSVREGEILGIAGLMGAGRTELMMSILGEYGVYESGTIAIDGKEVRIKSSGDAIAAGLGYMSEDRKHYGLVLRQDIKFNIAMASFREYAKNGFIDFNRLIADEGRYIDSLGVKTTGLEQPVQNLSGGNQQKVVLAKWLLKNPRVLVMDEPTRGIDVGAKVEIYNIMNELVSRGVGIVMISSELQEVLGMSDRVLVMHEGTIAAELDYKEATQEKVMYYATGGH